MADDDKSKATGSTSSRRTMAPAAREPAGADDRPAATERADDGRGWVDDLPDDELDELAAEVQRARLRRNREPREPSFGMSEGERDELQRTGRTVSPFTGERRGDWSRQRAADR